MAEETTGTGTPAGETPATPATWDEYIAGQPEAIRGLAEANTTGLKSALTAEREQRKGMAKELREATAKLDAGSDVAKQLGEMSSKYDLAAKRASFYEEAGAQDIGCANPKLAFLVASAEDLFTRTGEPDWKAIKEAAPELFQKATTANAGAGTGQQAPASIGMNEFIRAQARG